MTLAMNIGEISQIAEFGDPAFQFLLGTMRLHGYGVSQNRDLAVAWLERAAVGEFAPAQYLLATTLAASPDTHVTAFRWCEKAALKGFPPAQLLLGIWYECGVGTEQNGARAIEWMRRASKNRYSTAMRHLARIYADGRWVEKDEALSEQLLRQAAELGDSASAYLLGRRLFATDQERQVNEGLKWIKMAAAADLQSANTFLADLYEAGHLQVGKDVDLAAVFRRHAGETNKR